MHALADRLQTLRAEMETPAQAGLAALSLAFPRPDQPLWRVEPAMGWDADGIVDAALAAGLRTRRWRALARDAARAGLRYLSAGPGHRLAFGAGPLLFEALGPAGRPWACGTPLAMRLAAADLPDGRPVVLGGPARGHARLAALDAISRWAERHGLPAPDGTRIDADWWVAPGAALRRGPLVAVFAPEAPERIQLMRLWDA